MSTIKINICGDFTSQGHGCDAIAKRTAISPEILSLFSSSDLNIVNLEEPVATDNTKKILKSGPALRTCADTITYLKECDVQLVTLANNHFFDYGRHGVEKTLESLKQDGIDYVGGGLSNEEISKIYFYTRDDVCIAILNYCEHEFSVTDGCGSNGLNPIQVYKDIQKAKKESDHILVICHGGHEGYALPSPRMKELYRFFIDAGASIVCNHHQHCYSGYEDYNNGTIFYGLGNFFFYDFRPTRQQNKIWNTGYLVSINFSKNSYSYTIHPYNQCYQEKISVDLMGQDDRIQFKNDIEEKNRIIADDISLEEHFSDWCKARENDILTFMSPYSNKLLMALCRRRLLPKFISGKKRIQMLNTARCEAHRDVLIKVLKNI